MFNLNFPIETPEAIKFWGSLHSCNRAQSIIAFSLDEDNANDNLRRFGYKLFWRKRALETYGNLVATPGMDTVDFEFKEMEDFWWDCMPQPSDSTTPLVNIQAQSSDQTIEENGSTTISVKAVGAEVISYQWQESVDGTWSDSTYPGNDSEEMTVSPSVRTEYRCIVISAFNNVISKPINVLISYQDIFITLHPQDQNVNDDEVAVFTADASLYDSVQWFEKEVAIEGETSTTLTVPAKTGVANRSRTFLAKFYREDKIASTSTATMSTTTVLPTITLQPVSTVINLPASAIFTAQATEGTAQWEAMDRLTTKWHPLPGETNDTLNIARPVTGFYEKYRCVYTNRNASIYTNTATLFVLEDDGSITYPPEVTLHPVDTTVMFGEESTFTAEANYYTFVQWEESANGIDWVDSIRPGNNTTTLSFVGEEEDHGLSFRAVFSNGYGEATTDSAQLGIIMPYFLFVGDGGDQAGYSEASGYGDLEPRRPAGWDFDIQTLTGNIVTENMVARNDAGDYQPGVGTLTLTIDTLSSDLTWNGNQSRYQATNATMVELLHDNIGSGFDGSYSYTHIAPEITAHPQSETIDQGSSTTLSVGATDASPSGIVGYQWYRDGVEIEGETSDSFEIQTGEFETSESEYTCRVFNDGPLSTLSNPAIIAVAEINLYVNRELVGGALTIGDTAENNPPDDHSIGFNQGDVQSQPIDNGDGTFNWDSNFNGGTGRQYLSYQFTDNNPDLEEGVYEFTYDYFARTTGQQFSAYSGTNFQMETFDDRGTVGEWKRIGAILTVTGPYSGIGAQRIGNGVASVQARGGIISNPRIVKIANLDSTHQMTVAGNAQGDGYDNNSFGDLTPPDIGGFEVNLFRTSPARTAVIIQFEGLVEPFDHIIVDGVILANEGTNYRTTDANLIAKLTQSVGRVIGFNIEPVL